MAIYKITEDQSVESRKESMAKTILALEPITDSLTNKGDRQFFKGIPSLLIGKDIKLANIAKDKMYVFLLMGKLNFLYYYYQNIISRDFIRRNVGEYLNFGGSSVSEEALFIKYGIGGYTKQYLEQKVISPNIEEGRR